jgi:hypothetical protein
MVVVIFMATPFSLEEFINVFTKYNTDTWPILILVYILALITVYLLFRKTSISNKIISGVISFLWFWTGLVYHILYFTDINNMAYVFGLLFIIASILFLFYGVIKEKLNFGFKSDIYGYTGMFFVFFALLIYPLLGYIFGHSYPDIPILPLPCPLTIFTFGMLLMTKKISKFVVIIPLVWSFIGFTAALQFGIYQDFMLLIAGIVGTILLYQKYKNK